jgi:hypothetical protein
MREENLIRLGSICQAGYGMLPDYAIVHADSHVVMLENGEQIYLDNVAFPDDRKGVWVGYSRQKNTLFVETGYKAC